MPQTTEVKYCANCDGVKPHVVEKVNHILHLLLTIFTAGLWIIVWIALAVGAAMASAQCLTCGMSNK